MPPGDLKQEARAVVRSGPARHTPGGSDGDANDGRWLVVVEDSQTPTAQHGEHASVGDQYVGFEIRYLPGSRLLDQRVEEVGPEPAASFLGHRDTELPVPVGKELEAGFTHDARGPVWFLDDRHEPESASFFHPRHLLDKSLGRGVGGEEATVEVVLAEGGVERDQSRGI